MATVEVTKDNHDEFVKDGITFLDFNAVWCGPCRNFAPIYEDASERHSDIKFGTIDTDVEQELAADYGIRSIPTLAIYKDGVQIFAQPGSLPGPAFEAIIAEARGYEPDAITVVK